MKLFLYVLLGLPVFSLAQTAAPQYSDNRFTLTSQSPDSAGVYTKTSVSLSDPSLVQKKTFVDVAYSEVATKAFYKAGILDGPFEIYKKNQLALQGNYKSGKWDGHRLTYINQVLVQKAQFNQGVPTATWEEYNLQGQLKRKVTYDSTGKATSDIRY